MIPVISPILSFLVDHYQLLLIFPIIMAFASEKHYTGRVSIVANVVSMFVAVAPFWDQTSGWLDIGGFPLFHAYLFVGLIFGTIAFLSYIAGGSVESDFYTAAWVLYTSALAGLDCLVAAVSL